MRHCVPASWRNRDWRPPVNPRTEKPERTSKDRGRTANHADRLPEQNADGLAWAGDRRKLSQNRNRILWPMNDAVEIRPTSAIDAPDTKVSVREQFDLDVDLEVPAFSVRTEHVPDLDTSYKFDRETTLAICAGFAHNRRVMIQGYHGTGKSTHIEQVASRLNWPMIRVNLDSHVSRIDLVGKDAIVLREGRQVTEFREGILPWCIQRPMALVFDEYD